MFFILEVFYFIMKYPKQTNYVILPKRIICGVQALKLSNIKTSHCYKLIATLMGKSYDEYGEINRFVYMPRDYIVLLFSTEYKEILNYLLNEKIILSNNSYSNYINNIYSKQYSINLNYNTLSYMCSGFNVNNYKSVLYFSKKRAEDKDKKKVKEWVLEDLKRIKFDYEGMMDLVNKHVDDININNFRINENVLLDNMEVRFVQNGIYKTVRMNKQTALSRANEWDKTLIQDGNQYYIENVDKFIENKKEAVYIAYKNSVSKFEKQYFFGKRNNTNNRLDSNITSMANKLTDKICKDNNLVKFDLSNSQFAIMSYIVDGFIDTEDFNIFKNKSYGGDLYEYIQEKLKLKSRKEAKTMMFELMFSSHNYRSSLKKRLKELFPKVVEYVDGYKTDNGYQNFSINLQKKESEMFIDGLWKKMKGQKMFCLTKHDCLIVKEKDADKTLNIIQTYFDKIGFKGKIIRE